MWDQNQFWRAFFYVTTGDWTTLMLIFILFYLLLGEKLVKEVIQLGQSFKGITSTNKCELCRWAKVRAWAWATWQLRKDPKRNVWSVVFFLQPFPYSMPSTDTLALVNSEKQFSEVCFINFCSFSFALGAYISYWNYILGLYNSVRIRRVKWVRARIRARVRVTWQWMGRSFLLSSSGYPSLSQPLPDHDMNRPDLFIIFFFFFNPWNYFILIFFINPEETRLGRIMRANEDWIWLSTETKNILVSIHSFFE